MSQSPENRTGEASQLPIAEILALGMTAYTAVSDIKQTVDALDTAALEQLFAQGYAGILPHVEESGSAKTAEDARQLEGKLSFFEDLRTKLFSRYVQEITPGIRDQYRKNSLGIVDEVIIGEEATKNARVQANRRLLHLQETGILGEVNNQNL